MTKSDIFSIIIKKGRELRTLRNFLIESGLTKESDMLAARDAAAKLALLRDLAIEFGLTDADGFWELIATK